MEDLRCPWSLWVFIPHSEFRILEFLEFLEFRGHSVPECFLNRLQGDPIVNVGEEALDNEPDGDLTGNAAPVR